MTLDLKRHIKRTGLTQTQIAERTGTTRSYVSLLTNNQREPSPALLSKLADVFGVPVADLFATRHGMADEVRPFTPADTLQTEFLRALKRKSNAIELYKLNTTASSLSLLAGDLLALDLGRNAKAGDVVLATRIDDDGNGTTFPARYLDPWIAPGNPELPTEKIDDSGQVAILGPVVSVMRPNPNF